MGNWGYNPILVGVITLFLTGDGTHLAVKVIPNNYCTFLLDQASTRFRFGNTCLGSGIPIPEPKLGFAAGILGWVDPTYAYYLLTLPSN